jgi:hypothetical protein
MSILRFGVATRDITPSRPAWLDGYNSRPAPIGGVRERLQLGCLAVAGGRKKVLIVCCDLLGIEVPVCQELYVLLKKEVGIGYPDILIACSHRHFAPIVSTNGFAGAPGFFMTPDPWYMTDFRAKLVEAARESLRTLRPGRLETARLTAPQVHYNRRTRKRSDGSVVTNFLFPKDPENWELRPVDSELTVLRFRDASGVGGIRRGWSVGLPSSWSSLVHASWTPPTPRATRSTGPRPGTSRSLCWITRSRVGSIRPTVSRFPFSSCASAAPY